MATALLPMDYALLSYLEDHGTVPTVTIPARLFQGEIPENMPNLVDLGLIEHIGEYTRLTEPKAV